MSIIYSQLNFKYRPDIDGLRAIAVLAVVAFHAFPNSIKGGFIGVDIFFVISGYLITKNIFENLNSNTLSFISFYERRIRRIFPALIFVLTACLLFGWFILVADEYNLLGKHIAAGTSFISNFVFWKEAGYFDHSSDKKPLLHLWSLGIEEQFYILWPLFIWFLWKKGFNLLVITFLIAIISFYINVNWIKSDAVAAFYSPQTRFWELLSGSLLAWVVVYKKGSSIYFINKIGGKTLLNILSILGLILLIYGISRINKDSSFPGAWALIPVIGSVMLIVAGPTSLVNRVLLSNKIMVWIGIISFPLYLWHWPIISFATIYKNNVPEDYIRYSAVILSIVLAWSTYHFIEHPIRFGKYSKDSVALLCGVFFMIGLLGLIIYKTDFSQSLTFEKLQIKRVDSEHAYGFSMRWFRGKDNWLYPGNAFENGIAKLKLAIIPSQDQIDNTKNSLLNIAKEAAKHNTKVVLIIGPNKSSIYPEYLPDTITPSSKKYINFFLDDLNDVPNLIVYNPIKDLIKLKNTEGILYWKTDTHWNVKGAFLAYSGFSQLLHMPIPRVRFQQRTTYAGDLIGISNLKNFPLNSDDNWEIIWENKPVLIEKNILDVQEISTIGSPTIVTNLNPLTNKSIWVVGDSFTTSLKQYFNATFKEVRYIGVGNWNEKFNELPTDISKAEKKPDMIVIIKVERSF